MTGGHEQNPLGCAVLHGVRQRRHRQNGHNACGSAPFACRACGARRVLAPERLPTSAPRQQEILRAVATERLSLRAAERVFGVARQTIAKWLQKKPKLSRP